MSSVQAVPGGSGSLYPTSAAAKRAAAAETVDVPGSDPATLKKLNQLQGSEPIKDAGPGITKQVGEMVNMLD